jgi:hypothetical protein
VTDRGLFYRPIHSVKAALQKRRRRRRRRRSEKRFFKIHCVAFVLGNYVL